MNPFVFDLQYFPKTIVSPVNNVEYKAGSLVFFASRLDVETGDSSYVSAFDFALDNGSYISVQTFTVDDIGYTLSIGYDSEHGFMISFNYPHWLSISPLAFSFLSSLSSNVDDSSRPFFVSLNGKYGSFSDGTSVTVANKEGVFKVKSSELFWNDNDTKEYMIAYVLADSLGNFLMVPDIHVSLVKLTDLVS